MVSAHQHAVPTVLSKKLALYIALEKAVLDFEKVDDNLAVKIHELMEQLWGSFNLEERAYIRAREIHA